MPDPTRTVPEHRRCNTAPGCRNEAVVFSRRAYATTWEDGKRGCTDHPLPEHVEAVARGHRCSDCGGTYWPDFMHFHCVPRRGR